MNSTSYVSRSIAGSYTSPHDVNRIVVLLSFRIRNTSFACILITLNPAQQIMMLMEEKASIIMNLVILMINIRP